MLPILSYVQHYKKYHAARFEAASVQYGLNQLEIDILLFLHNNPECHTAGGICRYRGLAKSNVSAAVERLRARGVLTVSPAPDNRRQRLLGFAPDALPMVAVLADIQRCSLEPLFAGFTAQEQQTLQDYLMWQVELTPFTDTDRAIATSIVDAVDDTGYLTIQIEDIVDSIGDDEIGLEEVEAVLKRIQRFDPVGVAAKDLRDCLLIQLSQFAKETPWLEEARLIISDHLDLLANHDFRTLMRVTRLKEEVLKEAVNLIQSLDPRPGQSIHTSEPEYVIPDVLVRKVSGRWTVELNADSIPRLKINQQYAAMGNSARNDADGQFIRSNLQEARWLIKSLESRNDTLLRVSRCIVEQQQAFFEQGEEYMKPMVLADIAQAVEMHESTISRVTTQKYLHSPRGIFELKYFFSSHVNTEGGGEASSTAIRALVKKLIAAENPAKPLSDSKLTSMLSEQGIMVARRTVAKYRESLSIPPSNQRKQLV